MAAIVLDARGRIVLWSPPAESLFGYTAAEALGRYAGRLLVAEEHLELVLRLFDEVMRTGESWAGTFPMRHKDGRTHLLEFRNMRLQNDEGDYYALGLCAEQETLRKIEQDVALSMRLAEQSPIGLAVLDPELRYVAVNAALERIDGIPAEQRLGRSAQRRPPGHRDRLLPCGHPSVRHGRSARAVHRRPDRTPQGGHRQPSSGPAPPARHSRHFAGRHVRPPPARVAQSRR